MAIIGLKRPVYAIALDDSEGNITYSAGSVLAKAISLSSSPNLSDVKLYADDMVAEALKNLTDVSLSLNVDDLTDEAKKDVLGLTIGTSGEIISRGDDTNPYIGLGIVAGVIRQGVRKWRGIWFSKVIFAYPSETFNTKGQAIEFQTPTLEGTALVDSSGVWKTENTFDSESQAIAYINGKAGII